MLMAIIRKKMYTHTHTEPEKKLQEDAHGSKASALKNGLPVEIERNFSIGADVQDV